MGRRELALLLALLSMWMAQPGQAADVCTFGTDCFCACVVGPNRGDGYRNDGCADDGLKVAPGTVRVCHDWENPDYNPDINGTAGSDSWVDNGGLSGFRGGGSAWTDFWGSSAFSANWHGGEPTSPVVGDQCAFFSPSDCAAMEWTASDVFQANAYQPVIDIQTAGQHDDEISGLTLTSQFDGSQYFSARQASDECSDSIGSKSFSGGNDVYFVARIAYSTNLAASHGVAGTGPCSVNSDFVPNNWKIVEWGPSVDFTFFGVTNQNSGAFGACPFCGFIAKLGDGNAASCNTALNAAQTIGHGDCQDAGSIDGVIAIWPDSATYDRSNDWPLGTWGLARFSFRGLGTSSCSYDAWFWAEDWASERHLISFSGFDCSTFVYNSTLSPMLFNFYYNGGKPQCQGASNGCRVTQTIYMYMDNLLVGTGSAPPSAADLGWGVGGDGGVPPGEEPRKGGNFRGNLRMTDVQNEREVIEARAQEAP